MTWEAARKSHLSFFSPVPKANPLNYTQLPFYLNNLNTTQEVVKVIKAVRNISDYYKTEGLPNYPLGVPFTFWEQYIHLRFYLALSLVSLLGASFIIITLMLVNPWASLILVSLGLLLVELSVLFSWKKWQLHNKHWTACALGLSTNFTQGIARIWNWKHDQVWNWNDRWKPRGCFSQHFSSCRLLILETSLVVKEL